MPSFWITISWVECHINACETFYPNSFLIIKSPQPGPIQGHSTPWYFTLKQFYLWSTILTCCSPSVQNRPSKFHSTRHWPHTCMFVCTKLYICTMHNVIGSGVLAQKSRKANKKIIIIIIIIILNDMWVQFCLYKIWPWFKGWVQIHLIRSPFISTELDCGGVCVCQVGTGSLQTVGPELDAIQLSIFSHRFMSTAEQMGRWGSH